MAATTLVLIEHGILSTILTVAVLNNDKTLWGGGRLSFTANWDLKNYPLIKNSIEEETITCYPH